MRLRAHWYQQKEKVPAPEFCVSVGNIAWGGRGKSPFCRFLAEMLIARKRKPLLLTRGYKARPPLYPHRVRQTDNPVICGDEPLEFLSSFPELEVVVDPDRVRAMNWVRANLEFDSVILDDGFQHLRMPRDLDIVLLSGFDLGPGWNRVIPSGEWREDKNALKRADAMAINADGKDLKRLRGLAQERLGEFYGEVIFFWTEPAGLRRVKDGEQTTDGGGEYLLAAGIGDPQRFVSTAAAFLDAPPRKSILFPDHHCYTAKDWQKIKKAAAENQCPRILCTNKDAVKLSSLADETLYALDIRIRMEDEDLAAIDRMLGHGLQDK